LYADFAQNAVLCPSLPEQPQAMNEGMLGDFSPVLDTLSSRLPEMNPDQNS